MTIYCNISINLFKVFSFYLNVCNKFIKQNMHVLLEFLWVKGE